MSAARVEHVLVERLNYVAVVILGRKLSTDVVSLELLVQRHRRRNGGCLDACKQIFKLSAWVQ
jgi:hypothetical protein